jgi:hypothetical protein
VERRRVDAEEATTGCGVRRVDAEEATSGCGVRRADAEEATNRLFPSHIIRMHGYTNLKIPYKIAYTNSFPYDEHMMFETCRSRQELN